MIHSKGTWKTLDDLKNGHGSFLLAFAEFVNSDDCPISLKKVIESSNFQASQNSIYSQSTDSKSCEDDDLGTHILKDLAEQNEAFIKNPCDCDLLPDGGENFNWHE